MSTGVGRGGRRAGAGRPKGARSGKLKEREAEVAKSGLTPLDYLLSVVRDVKAEQSARTDAAKAAAPYVHPRLNAIDFTGQIEHLTHEQALGELDDEDGDGATE